MTAASGIGGDGLVETPHFRVLGSAVEAREPFRLDNDLADAIVTELAPLGLVPDIDAFERLFTRTVEGSAPIAALAWNGFYRNTLARLRAERSANGQGSVAVFARIYAEVAGRLTGRSLLDVGSCFGFLPLLIAQQRPAMQVLGSDVSVPTVALANRVARCLRNRAIFLAADAGRLPVGDRSVDTVTVVHLLEHLPPMQGAAVLREALRVAIRRVLIAVPVEEQPNPAFGHLRTFTVAGLAELGSSTGWPYRTWAGDCAWLQLDRCGT